MIKLISSIALLLLLAGPPVAAQPPPPPTPGSGPMPVPAPPSLGARSYILVDFFSGVDVVTHNADERVEPASITKLMTGYAVFNELDQGNIALDDLVPISERAWKTGGSRMFVDPSMQVTVEDLLRGMIIQSGNDASVALAEYVAGSEEAFSGVMNHYAEALGMTNTNFVNSTGWPDENHYSTARDIATLSVAMIRDFPEYYRWYSEKEFTFNGIRQHNRNTLLWRDPAVDGLKTGHTESAGYCLASSANRDGMRLVSVVMGSNDESSRASESQSLLNYGFRFFETVQLYNEGDELAQARVWKGTTENVAVGIDEAVFVTIPRGRYEDLDAQVEMMPQLEAPLAASTVIGKITVQLDDEVITERDLVTLGNIEEAGFFGRSWDSMKLWVDDLFADDE
ncbi:MAG TPA: D-alanyl-D-alanine carboxypeptidase family protein [Xanthomonadales bacterium]|nr:D-alanyl-D-alanine carboxypeptidase family protein [Xanthomonadales bacterium]